ncbi:FMRFamide receptor isoform X2 [Acyrthosiphon pisum]|nr:FMRFamide receptor isoform X2 [Acyrthosiphon pisum]XP_016663489.1 FMRFamide receptor isoform X2 [Acyrthosiphon pisum]|eukprot:XP_003247524.1 PREDICTED: FMRFamide receptor isoform X2 [Acyrthosiphon pisum]
MTMDNCAALIVQDQKYCYFRKAVHFWAQQALLPAVVAVGVVGNMLSVVVLTREPMKSSTSTYLTALAVSDLFYLLFVFTISFENYPWIVEADYYIYWKWYPYGLWLTDAASNTSVLLTVSFTVERYIAVCHPLRGRVLCTESRAKRVILMVALFCILCTATTPHEWHIAINAATGKFQKSSTELGRNDIYKKAYNWFCIITFICVPLLVLAVLNWFLINAVNQSRRNRTRLTCQGNVVWNRQRQENKMTMTLIAVVIMFCVCQTPTAVMMLTASVYEPPEKTPAYYVNRGLHTIFNFLMVVNAASNFMLYCAMSRKYRRTLMITFMPFLGGPARAQRYAPVVGQLPAVRHHGPAQHGGHANDRHNRRRGHRQTRTSHPGRHQPRQARRQQQAAADRHGRSLSAPRSYQAGFTASCRAALFVVFS